MGNNDAPLLQPTKSEASRSELWISVIGVAGSLLSALTASKPGAAVWVSLGSLVTTTVAYALLRTPIATEHPGWRSKSFWASLAVILLTAATAISETDIPGLPDGVTKGAAIVVAALTAAGYTAIRWDAKQKATRSFKSS